MSQYAVGPAAPTADLNSLVSILGTTRTVFWPFLESVGSVVDSYGENAHILQPSDEGGAVVLESQFIPVRYPSGIHSYFIDRSQNNHLNTADSANFSHSAGTDAAFSVGAWIFPTLAGTLQDIMAKFDIAGAAREWRFTLSAAELLGFHLFDESVTDANAAVEAPGSTTLPINEWSFAVGTYGGQGGNPGFSGSSMSLIVYLNGVADTGTVAGTGSDDYVDMEDLGAPLMVGAGDDQAAPVNEFEGRLALPFQCGKALSATEVASIYEIGRRLIGLT